MGGGSWSDDAYTDRAKVRSDSGKAAFAYSADIDSGRAARAAHATMDPKATAGPKSPFVGAVMRESRDSDDHPKSLAIGVFFDVTGSMHEIPKVLETKLAGLMKLLLQKGYVADPQVLFGAIGDAQAGDNVPLQVGQFESDVTMDDNLTNIYLERGGGGGREETYELAHYFFARHTATDCWEKRQKKGYFFTIGDEGFYPKIRKGDVLRLIGDTLQHDLSTEEVVKELQERYHVFHIIAEQGSYPHNPGIEGLWQGLLGQHVLKLEDSANVAELIALTIGLNEGTLDIDSASDHLKDIGADAKTVRTVTEALVPYAKSVGLSKSTVTGDLPAVSGGGKTARL